MKKIALFLALGFFLISPAYAQNDVSAEEKALIKELLGADTVEISFDAAAHMIRLGIRDMRSAHPDADPAAFDEVEEELLSLMKEEMQKDAYLEIFYTIYAKHFTADELKEMIAFNKTPLGSKIIKTMPQIFQETMVATEAWTLTLKPKFRERLQRRIEQEEKEEKEEQDKYKAGKAK